MHALTPSTLSVLRVEGDKVDGAGDGGETDESKTEGVTLGILGSIRGQETEGSDDPTTVTEADLEGGTNAAPQVSADCGKGISDDGSEESIGTPGLTIGTEPTNNNRTSSVLTHSNQKQRSVPHVHTFVDSQEDDQSNDGDKHQREDEDVSPLVIVGGGRDDHTQREGGNPGGDRVELSLNGAETEGSEDSGGEVRITIPRNDEAEIHETTEDDLEILEDAENIPPGRLNIELRITYILSEPCLDKGFLAIG